MGHYRGNLRDIEFNLFEVLGRAEVLGKAPYSDVDLTTARDVLAEVMQLASGELAASFADGDRTPPVFDPTTHTAPVPAGIRKSFDAWMQAGYWRLLTAAEVGGTPAPPSLYWALGEIVLGANPVVWMYTGGPLLSRTLVNRGTDRDRAIAGHIVEHGWGGTMVLTEPDAGSDVGAGRTRATRNDDGTWNIEGVKRFITSAESDLYDQVIHLVLARPHGVEGAGGPGTKGLSLFVVPKYHFDLQTGQLGARNGVYVTGVEHKMGLKSSNTCELTFGDPNVGGGEPAVGYLLGEVHDGIAQMFDVIQDARMLVGTKAIATLSTGYLNALEYAKTRVQGADLTRSADKTAPRVTITHHPDVRRSLMAQKSFSEAMRALVLYTATWQDSVAIHQHAATTDSDEFRLAQAVNDLLLPVVKGYGSERSWVLLGTETLQTFGGSGYLQDYPIEQYVRDAKIDTLYEGTTAIQGLDLFFRKIAKNQGQALGHLAAEIQRFLDAEDNPPALKNELVLLGTALEDTTAMVGHLFTELLAAQTEVRNLYKVGLNTTRLLMALGDVVCAWLLLRQATIALGKLDGAQVSPADRAFYTGKVAAAKFFAQTNLPKLTAERAILAATDLEVMDLDESAF
jgi:alkylation response protein AidB-like acyl-CoA dehydrogenase